MALSLIKMGQLALDKLAFIRKCQEWGLIPLEGVYKCPKCGNALHLRVSSRTEDGYRWVCDNMFSERKQKRKKCTKRISLRTHTFFEGSQLSLIQIVSFMTLWVQSYKIEHIVEQTSISRRTAVDWASFCREVAHYTMVEQQEPLGGDGKTVEIDEYKFTNRKFNVGRPVKNNWVFGGYERGSGRVFMVPVENRTTETLIAVINKWILPGTSIISECWKAYATLTDEGYKKESVNHTLHFVDPVTKAHTNSIQSAWNAAKLSISPPNRKDGSLPGNLARYMLVKKAKADGLHPGLFFYKLAGQLYNPLMPRENFIRRPEGEIEELEEEEGEHQ